MSIVQDLGQTSEERREVPPAVQTPVRTRHQRTQDALAALDTRVARVEIAVADALERLDLLEQVALPSEDESSNRLAEELSFRGNVEGMLARFEAKMEDMQREWITFKESPFRGAVAEARPATKLDLPKPKAFKGNRDAKEIDNFLWGLEQYFDVACVTEHTKVRTAALYLIDDAMLWWRLRQSDTDHGTSIQSWQEFKVELKKQFYPEDESFQARKMLKALKQTGNVKDYIREFSSLRLRLPDMPPTELLFNFMDGLQGWAQLELRRQRVQNLSSAIAAAEGLMDYTKSRDSKQNSKEFKENGGGDEDHMFKERGDNSPSKARDNRNRNGSSASRGGQQNRRDERRDTAKPRNKCFLCGGDHYLRDCPRRAALSAMLQDSECEQAQMGTMQMLNSLRISPVRESSRKGLMFVEVSVEGQTTKGLVDTGASHNFIAVDEAKRLGLKVVNESGWCKAVNSAAKPVEGVARGVRLRVGTWEGPMDFSVVPIDDFSLVLGMGFFDNVKAVPVPFLRSLVILEDEAPCMVSALDNGGMPKGRQGLSAMQVVKDKKQIKSMGKRQCERVGSLMLPKDKKLIKSMGNRKCERVGSLILPKDKGSSPLASEVAKDWGEQANVVRPCLTKAAKKKNKWVNKKCHTLEFKKRVPRRGKCSGVPKAGASSHDLDVKKIMAGRVLRGRSVPPKRHIIKKKGYPNTMLKWKKIDEGVDHLGGGECHDPRNRASCIVPEGTIRRQHGRMALGNVPWRRASITMQHAPVPRTANTVAWMGTYTGHEQCALGPSTGSTVAWMGTDTGHQRWHHAVYQRGTIGPEQRQRAPGGVPG